MEDSGYAENHVEENKQRIRDFIKENKRLPSQHKPEEKQLYTLLASYCNSSSAVFDSTFRAEMEAHGYGQRKKKIIR